MISYMTCCGSLAAANPAPGPAQRADANDGGYERDADLDRAMDADEERDYADQDPSQTWTWRKMPRFLRHF